MSPNKQFLINISETDLKSILKEVVTEIIIEHKMITPENKDELGGIELAMKVTGLSKQTIYQKVSKDQIPYIKKGRLYFRKSTLLKWIENDNLNF